MQFSPLKSRRTHEEVAHQLREMIVSGRLKEGDKLPPERDLAQQLGVSRHSLREALRTLEVAGLLETRLGKWGGTFVMSRRLEGVSGQMADLLKMGDVSYASVMEARIYFSEVVVRVACVRHTQEDVDRLNKNIEEAEQLFQANQLTEKTEKNIEFHDLLAQATKNPTLVILMQSLTSMARYFARNIGPDPASTTVRSRRLFMEAFVRRDAEAAVREMQESLLTLRSVHTDLAASVVARRGQGKSLSGVVKAAPKAPKAANG
ncbi:MAG TPA: FadR/GntR family transcriptional regulator [Ramlibacter sp.]|jgi:DNA-binding FadR family transcriptional regulator|nr:FadR/GntR family transcriptional regulator [Ramlibacter sp.]